MSTFTKIVIKITLFAVSMAFLESAVVIYLRELYYPAGFDFPLKMMDISVGKIEFLREAATLVMIISLALLTGKTNVQKFAVFIYVFAVWDIFYYVFLKLTINWPVSFMTWDILFLIPVTWVGPVIAPVINSLMMIVLARGILYAEQKNVKRILLPRDWLLLIIGSLIVVFAYIEDYVGFLLIDYSFSDLINIIYSEEIVEKSLSYVPVDFAWSIFIFGTAMHAGAILDVFLRGMKLSESS